MKNFLIPKDTENRIRQAIRFFWNTRDGQILRQEENSVHDQGNRGAVTGGKQLDGFLELIRQILIENEVAEGIIFVNKKLELPGFFRPTKKWDLLVVDREKLILAIELKSQVGPSFGNNFNNRTEEAMGSALDIWTAFREGVFKNSNPWLGYLMVLEDCNNSSSPISIRSSHFSVMKEFENSSYIKRYEVFCNKLVLERQYNAACFLTSRRDSAQTGDFNVPNEQLSFYAFLVSMLSAVFTYHAAKGNV
ncbi:MAG: PaeR7I family type II restriction endonuclease [Synergistaceae bacterium]|nr:PaeR7I family type II restriction endonuclease [Synergistaceae bacterium]